jgi:hypothetical protein
MYKKLLLLLALTALIAGCGQQVPQVSTTMAAPGNLKIQGVVYSISYYASGGYYYSHFGPTVSGATVTLLGTAESKTALTNDKGEYMFENVRYGDYYVKGTKDGYQSDITDVIMSAVEGSVTTLDLSLSVHPVVRSVSPAPNSTIEASATFTVTFNEPMDTATVRPRIAAGGIRTFAAGDTAAISCAWSGGDTILTITPQSTLSANQIYRLYLANTFEDVKDKDGNILAINVSYTGGVPIDEDGDVIEQTNDYFTYKTTAGGAPTAPSGLTIGTSGGQFTATGVDYAALFGGTADVDFNWTPSTSGNVTGYKVYIARSSTGPWCLLSATTTNLLTAVDVPTTIRYALFDAAAVSVVDPVSTRNFPFINEKIYVKVVAYNGEGESSASAANAIELNPPGLSATVFSGRALGAGFTAQRLGNGYYLAGLTAGTDTTTIYIAFDEPVDASTIIAANFTISGGRTITGAELLTSSSADLDPAAVWAGSVYSIVKLTANSAVSTDTITIGTGVKDLAGNAIPASTTVVIP